MGESMEPTLYIGDIMVVNQNMEPKVGDIVVCRPGGCEFLIIRQITAGSGDVVEFEGQEMVLGDKENSGS